MEINKVNNDGTEVLSITGRLDTVTSPLLQEALAEPLNNALDIELDFTGVEYVSSAGLRVLLQAQKTSQTKNKSVTLKNVSPEIMEVFEITGFSNILNIT